MSNHESCSHSGTRRAIAACEAASAPAPAPVEMKSFKRMQDASRQAALAAETQPGEFGYADPIEVKESKPNRRRFAPDLPPRPAQWVIK